VPAAICPSHGYVVFDESDQPVARIAAHRIRQADARYVGSVDADIFGATS
jgi:hypothetical protein